MCGGAIPGKELRSHPRRESLSVDHKRRVFDSFARYRAKREGEGRIGASGRIKRGRDRCCAIEELCEDGSNVSCCVGSKNILRPLLRQERLEAGVVIRPETSRSRSKDRIHIRQNSLIGRREISAGLRLRQGLK